MAVTQHQQKPYNTHACGCYSGTMRSAIDGDDTESATEPDHTEDATETDHTEDASDTETEIVAAGNLDPPPVTAPVKSRELRRLNDHLTTPSTGSHGSKSAAVNACGSDRRVGYPHTPADADSRTSRIKNRQMTKDRSYKFWSWDDYTNFLAMSVPLLLSTAHVHMPKHMIQPPGSNNTDDTIRYDTIQYDTIRYDTIRYDYM